jgi:hypothetical protein
MKQSLTFFIELFKPGAAQPHNLPSPASGG